MRRVTSILLASVALGFLGANFNHENAKQALTKLQTYVGSWKGVGQLQRGSRRGAWLEKSEWKWSFSGDAPTLAFSVEQGKYFKTAKLSSVAGKGSSYVLDATTVDGKEMKYLGDLKKGVLVLSADKVANSAPARITIRTVANGKRLVMLYERSVGADQYRRMSEVGYTREGSNFGKGVTYVECVVTGGKAAIPVKYEGRTYYVCCGGCREYFEDDPGAVIAEYKARKAEEKRKLDS
ncbi:MAG: hypothetical protein QGG36_23800 [Pirellulaceae bacterium]|jgi:YHS domain-containing protein|nr:hypothetical protein [Pirellulaceae bacterium]MDP7018846.1 hypothetical protein [Pirellulaceae bacterium]